MLFPPALPPPILDWRLSLRAGTLSVVVEDDDSRLVAVLVSTEFELVRTAPDFLESVSIVEALDVDADDDEDDRDEISDTLVAGLGLVIG